MGLTGMEIWLWLEWTSEFGWNGSLIVFSLNGNLSGLDKNGDLIVVGMDICVWLEWKSLGFD